MRRFSPSHGPLPFRPADVLENITLDKKYGALLLLVHKALACLDRDGEHSCPAEKYVALFISYSNATELVLFSMLSRGIELAIV